MPLPSTNILAGPYTPNGITKQFAFAFPALSAAEVRVYVVNAQGVETNLNGYDVIGVGGESVANKISFTTAPNYPNQALYVTANPSFTQPADFTNQGDFDPVELNKAFDREALRSLALLARIAKLEAAPPTTGGGTGGGTGGTVTSIDWQAITNRPTSFPSSQHNHPLSDISGFGDAMALKANLDLGNVTAAAFQAKGLAAGLAAAGTGGSSTVGGARHLGSFGHTLNLSGTATGDNDAAIVAAEAASERVIWVPEGTIKTTKFWFDLTKHYVGPGSFICADPGNPGATDGAFRPANFSYARVMPTNSPTQGIDGWFRGDQRFTDGGEWKVIGAGVRNNITAKYYDSTLIPHHAWLDVYSGNSGIDTRLAIQVNPGEQTATLWAAADDMVIGTQFRFASDANGVDTTQTYTVDQAPAVGVGQGGVIHFTPAATKAWGAGSYLTRGPRTMNLHSYTMARAQPGAHGDVYGHLVRVQHFAPPYPGQKHVFDSCTIGQYGGDVDFRVGGVYGTGWESQYLGNTFDVAVIGQVNSYIRNNDTGALGAMWLGLLEKSEGTKPADAVMVAAGKWRTVIDTVRADLTTFVTAGDQLNVWANLALGHRISFNSKALGAPARSADPNGFHGGAIWGSTPGDMFLDSGNDGISDYISIWFNRAAPNNGRLRIRPTAIQTNVNFNAAGTMTAGLSISLGGQGLPQLIFVPGSGNYITFNTALNRYEFYKQNTLVNAF